MNCFLYPTISPSSPSPNPNPNSTSDYPNLLPHFSFEFPALERDYMGLSQEIIDQNMSSALAAPPLIHKSSLADPSSHDDALCGSHLRLAPPSSGTDANEGGDADDEEPLSANIGWPPISSYRKSTTKALSIKPACSIETTTTTPLLVHEAPLEDNNTSINVDDDKQEEACTPMKASLRKPFMHIKVSMDGTPIMRKLDLETMQGYQHLSLELHKLFKFYKRHLSCEVGVHSCFKDLNGASFFLTYKDRDGDWMLVGDTPWESFAQSARRIRIMKKEK